MKARLVAHRGYSARHPENSLSGLRAALELGCDGIEFDVQMSADGHLFVHHDADLTRTAGLPVSLLETNADLLRSTRLLGGGPTDTIPRLGEVVALLEAYPDATAFVEIKGESLARFGRPAVLEALLADLKPCLAQCVLISFDHEVLQQARLQGSVRIGWVVRRYNARARRVALALQPEFLIVNHRKLPARRPPWPGPWSWMLYELNRARRVPTFLRRGIDHFETAEVERMLASPVFARADDSPP